MNLYLIYINLLFKYSFSKSHLCFAGGMLQAFARGKKQDDRRGIQAFLPETERLHSFQSPGNPILIPGKKNFLHSGYLRHYRQSTL